MNLFDAIRKGAEPPIWGYPPGNASARRISWTWQPGARYDYQEEAGDLWLNGVVMMGLRFKACAISEMRPVVQEWNDEKRDYVEASPSSGVKDWLRAFTEPTDDYDWTTMLGSVQLSDDVAGNAFLVKRQDNAGRPRAGYRYEPHFLMEAVSNDDKKLITGYQYGAPGSSLRPLGREAVVHLRAPFLNPRERRLGITPLAAVLRDICADNELTNWLAAILRNGAMPSHLLIPKAETDTSLWQSNKGSLADLFRKFVRDARGEVMTAPAPMEAIKMMWSPAELEIATLQQGPSARICGALGIDPMIIGLPSPNKTYSNFAEAVDACGKQTILPTTSRWMREFSRQTARDFGLDPQRYRLWLDTSRVSWLQDETDALHDRVRKNFLANLIDLYRAQEMIGEKPDPANKGVYYWMLKPVAAAPAAPAGKEESKHFDRVRRSHEALKALGM